MSGGPVPDDGPFRTATLDVSLDVPTAGDMYALGQRLSRLLRAGDLVVLSGELGAGKTTLTRGIGAGMHVRGEVTSPTFVIAREHPATGGGPALVHVDAYRLGSLSEVDDLDLDSSLPDSVTVVEWGAGLVEELAPDRLDVLLTRPHGTAGDGQDEDGQDDAVHEVDENRAVRLLGYGARWSGVRIEEAGS